MNADAQKARSLFLAAVENVATEQWGAFLEDACGGDQELRRRVEILLRAHQASNSLIDGPAPDVVATIFGLARVKPPAGLHGRDLTPLLKNPAAEWPHSCLYEHTGDHFGDDVTKVLKDNPKGAIY